MDNQDENIAFCFRCAMKRQDANMQVPTFMQNAYPGLVLKDWLVARSQPLINAYYWPTANILPKQKSWKDPLTVIYKKRQQKRSTSQAKPTLDDLNDFEDWFIWHHETAHLNILNRTPAKDLARLHLAFVYDSLLSLMLAKTSSETENAWNRFQVAERQLDIIYNNIAFVEELFASVIAFSRIEKYLTPEGLFAGFQEQFEELQQRALQYEEVNFPGFTASYERIRHFLQAGNVDELSFTSYTFIYLQAIELSSIWTSKNSMRFYALNAKERLDYLLNIMEKTSNMEEMHKLLEPSIEKIHKVWKKLIGLMYLNTDESSPLSGDKECRDERIPLAFWLLSHGQYRDSSTINSAEEYSHYLSQTLNKYINIIRPDKSILLHRATYRGQSYIGSRIGIDDRQPPVGIESALGRLAFYEAIRQQIETRKGIICPNNNCRQRCRCPKEYHDGLLQLSHLAVGGFFGVGDWSLLPCRL